MAGQSGINQVGVQFPTSISQSGELWPEAGELVPHPLGTQPAPGVNWPPAGFVSGTQTGDLLMATTLLHSTMPTVLDLEWIQGDTKKVAFLLIGVNWTEVNPAIEDQPDWEPHTWAAQVRNPYIFWQRQTNHWVPAYGFQYEWWRQHSGVAEFDVQTSLVYDVEGAENEWATKVELTIPAWMSERIRPGTWYRWDVQSRTVPENDTDPEVQTHYRGRCRIVTEWTIA